MRSRRSVALTGTQADLVVHVAGPIEVEKVGTRRYQRQRCLRCDRLLRDEREKTAFWLLGQRIGIGDDGWSHVIEHLGDHDHEFPCIPTPLYDL
jgi:hypothetical protein